MRKIAVLVVAAATALVLAVGSGSAGAASGSFRDCDAAGGTYIKSGPDSICVFPEENVGNAPDHSNSQTTQSTTTGQGNLSNDPETVCEGPPGQC
jgi:hypothetical protein